MSWLDIVILIIMAVNALIGLKAGIIKAVLSMVGMIVGVILAGRYYMLFSERLSFIPQESLAKIIAFVIILIGVIVIASIIAWFLTRAASAIMLGWVNHLGGAVFGLVLGAIICSVLLIIWVRFLGIEAVISDSRIAAVLLHYFSLIYGLLPDEFNAVSPFF